MTARFLDRPLSWSQLQAFAYSKEDWYDNYLLDQKQPPNSLMLAGSRVGDAIGTPLSPIPELVDIGIKEYTVRATIDGISMVGHLDGYIANQLIVHENKCSDKPNRWTQGKVDKHGQLDMYLLLLKHQDGVEPEEVTCYLNAIHLKQTGLQYEPTGEWRQFTTRRTEEQLDNFLEQVKQTVEEMHQYIKQRQLIHIPPPRPPAFKGVE